MKYDGYTVGPKLRQLRKDKKLSLYRVSEKTGLSQSSITQVEQGGRNLSMKILYRNRKTAVPLGAQQLCN
ncbi:helix-turn-helix protein [Herbinix hemicellulosilytica]|uniref:HTH cro/C1-type domain-containing protein n=1 Tax=Herbinix hemicellulosilytica TaxID=1564487 RepID=A0A0H5SJ29_HERHM|nr:helix-turn-helix transcriptional regulator [Herbinix hemicellulosilytica]RBP57071.1 helix-turn-helix protein [Herbinix hemicellulosilytica]CRZ35080.1 hypothetical protein HHT355_1881 [Herbinix hemicellulosilytica]